MPKMIKEVKMKKIKANEPSKNALQQIVAVAHCSIQCAPEGENKLPTVTIEAYSGGIMTVGWYGAVVIDIKALKVKSKIPVLYRHDDYNIDNILGQTTAVTKSGNAITMQGNIMANSETAKKVINLSKNGFDFQASVGVLPEEFKRVREDETLEINGQKLKGPFLLMTKGTLREISIVPLGADGSTSAKIAAENKPQGKRSIMPNLWNKLKTAVTAKKEPSSGDIEAKLTRLQEILANQEATEDDITEARAIMAELSADEQPVNASSLPESNTDNTVKALQAEVDKMKGKLEAMQIKASRIDPPNINTGATPEVTQEVLCASVAIGAGLYNVEKAYTPEACNAASDLKIHSLTDFIQAALATAGKSLTVNRHQTAEFLKAAFSTRNIANILSNVANKFVLQGYGTVEQAWREVAFRRSVVDFKTHTGVRLILGDLLKELGPNGEIKHGSLSDETRSIAADTKALMLSITRKDIINDDLGVLSDLPVRFGFAAGRTFNKDFWAALVAAAGNFSAAAGAKPKNLTTTTALSIAGVTAAELLFNKFEDADGNPLGLQAKTILTPPDYHAAARQIYASTNLVSGEDATTPSTNIHSGRYNPVMSAYLPTGAWYLVGEPLAIPLMEVAFLNGKDAPTVESADADFNLLGIDLRCFYDYGVAFGDKRAAVKATV